MFSGARAVVLRVRVLSLHVTDPDSVSGIHMGPQAPSGVITVSGAGS